MRKYKVCVYAICKNEAPFADRWMDSMSEADGVFVLDTGSTDRTVELLRKRGAAVNCGHIMPWRFDAARNAALAFVPEDADICVCTDLDECFDPGWRAKLEATWAPGTTDASYVMNFDFLPDGQPHTQYYIGKAHTRGDFFWKWPCHEYLAYASESLRMSAVIEGLYINHRPDPDKSRESYLGLLKSAVREAPGDARMSYYLGREYMYLDDWENCTAELTRQLALPSSVWREERCACMRWLAKARFALGDKESAYAWYHKAIAECPDMREVYVEFAKIAFKGEDWETVFYCSQKALAITEKSLAFINEGYAWDHTPHDLAGLACWALGMCQSALEHAKKALALSPWDERLKENVRVMEKLMNDEG